MKYNLIALLSLLPLFLAAADSADQKIGLVHILEIAQKRHGVLSLAESKQEAIELAAIGEASLDNPVVSYGRGRLKYNGGMGLADYDEFNVSQKISINGAKSGLRKQGRLLGEIANIEGQQSQLSFSSSALLAGIRFFVAKEKFQHVEERRKFFQLVSRFLKSRKFPSPQKQLEVQLIESKLEEVSLETNEVKASLDLAREVLGLYIGPFSEESIDIELLENSKIKTLAEKFSKKDLAETQVFSKMQKVLRSKETAAGRQWIPDLQVYFSQTDEKFSGGNKNQVLGLGIEVPIFNVGKNKKAALHARDAVTMAEYEIKKNRSLSMKSKMLKQIRVGLDYVAIYNSKKIDTREKSLFKFERDFKKGLVSAANFLEFEDSVHMIHNRRLESQYEIYDGLLNLIELSGDQSALKELL